jgi:hypothetical protein
VRTTAGFTTAEVYFIEARSGGQVAEERSSKILSVVMVKEKKQQVQTLSKSHVTAVKQQKSRKR